jgi:YVTN family beta-propeller protein
MSVLRFRLLGPLEVSRAGVPLELGPRKQRAVLALLLLNANRVVATERLIDDLWGDAPPETARSALQVYIAGLRKAFGTDGATLRTRAPGYVLELRPGSLDLDRFVALRTEARAATDDKRKAELLHGALGLWRGAPLAELGNEPFAPAAVEQLEQLRRGALEERINADLALGRHAELIAELSGLVAESPYHEPFRVQLMLALYRAGRQADALAAYRAAREAFMDGLGLEPGPELKALERAVLGQDPALGAPETPLQPAAAELRPRSTWWKAGVVFALVAVTAVVAAVFLSRDEAPITAPPNSLAVIDPETNDVTGVVPVGIAPGPVAFGGDALWVGTLDKTLQRVDPDSLAVAKTFSLGATPTGVAFGGDAAWVAHGLTGKVSRIDPELAGVTEITVAQTRLLSTGAIAYGVGAVWSVFGDTTFGRIDPVTGRLEWTYAPGRPTAVVEGGGSVWVVSLGNSTVYRYAPATFLEGPIGRASVGGRSTAIAFGHGFAWVTSEQDDLVARVDPGNYASFQVPVGDRPVSVAVGDGAVWVANAGDGTVSRIDPETSKVVATIDVGQAPAGIAVGHGLVWVTVQAP